jgi:hypothetical protein
MPGTERINAGSNRGELRAYNLRKSERSRARNAKIAFRGTGDDILSYGGLMVLLPGESIPVVPSISAGSGAMGLLLCRDLIFTSKIKGTAAELGYPITVAGTDSQAHAMIEAYRPSVVLVDLNAGDVVTPAALIAYQKITGPNVWYVAFGSHIDVERLAAARAAGCHVVLARSRFTAELPELLRRCFSQPPRHDSQAHVASD